MYCKYCGTELNNDAKFCPNCGKPVNEETSLNQTKAIQSSNEDSGSLGWGILGFFIPIVGLILYLVWKDSKPKDALMAGKGALISVIVSVVLVIFSIIINSIVIASVI